MNAFENDLMLDCLAAHGSPAHAEFLGTKAAPVGTQDKNLRTVRSELILNGQSVLSVCRKHGISRPTFYRAMKGKHLGPKARQLLADVMNSVRGGA